MREERDAMEKKFTPTPGVGKSNTPIGGRLRAKVGGTGCVMRSFNADTLIGDHAIAAMLHAASHKW